MSSQNPSVIPVKIQCACGQKYAFDVEPVNGRLPQRVACPACGADGTDAANEIIAQQLAAGGSGVAPRGSRKIFIGIFAAAIGALVLAAGVLVAIRIRSALPPPGSLPGTKPVPSYADFPKELQRRLDKMKGSLKNSGGFCVAGRVTLSDGAQIRGTKDVQINIEGLGSYTCQVSEGGWFVSPEIRSQSQRDRQLELRAFNYSPIDFKIDTEDGSIQYVAFEMARVPPGKLSTIHGTVKDEHGAPIEGAKVDMGFALGASFGYSSPRRETKSGADGGFSFAGLPPTSYRLVAFGSGLAFEALEATPNAGEVLETNFDLYSIRKVTFDYVLQKDDSRNFNGGNLTRGTMTWDESKGGIKFSPRKHNDYADDLRVRQKQTNLSFICSYGAPKGNGFYDAGAVDFMSVTDAAESGYSMRSEPCLAGHVYVVKTYDGHYAKLLVKAE